MPDKPRTNDRVEERDEELRPETSLGAKDELLVGPSGRADIAGRLIDENDDVGEYEGSDESLAPDYEYRVSTSVSDRYGEYPGPGDDDLPLGYTTDSRIAQEEGLSYYPPDDPATIPSDDDGGLEIAAGYAPSMRDAGLEDEDLPIHIDNNDLDLAQDVVAALELASLLTGFRLTIKVRRGVVRVKGVVSNFDDLGLLESVLMNVAGVDDVEMEDVDVSDDDIEGQRVIHAPQAERDTDQ